MRKHFLTLQEKALLKEVLKFSKSKNKDLYIVGGFLRDFLMARVKNNPDIDFCLKKGSIEFARSLSKELRAGFVVLDREHASCRIVKKMENKIYTLDFTDFRGKTLEDDLRSRDFTVNSLAMKLEDAFIEKNPRKYFIDVNCAQQDLQKKIVRAVSKNAFDDDPLRILRAFSLECIFKFKIDKDTLRLIKIKKNKIAAVSWERLRDELFKILESSAAYECLVKLEGLKILDLLFPEALPMRGLNQGPYHHLDVLKHSLETVRQLEILVEEFSRNKDVKDYLNQETSGGRVRLGLLKLGAFLHDIGKPAALRRRQGKIMFHGHELVGRKISENISVRLKLSNNENDALRKMVFWHLRPGYLADNELITERAKFRYFRDTDKEAASVLLLSMADQRSTRGPLTTKISRIQHEKACHALIKEYFKNQKNPPLPKIINGNDVMHFLKLSPGPLVGEILLELQELQAIGAINNKKQALEQAKIYLKNKNALKSK